MIEFTAISVPKGSAPGRSAAPAAGGPAGFTLALSGQLEGAEGEPLTVLPGMRQVFAADGGELPVAAVEGDAADDKPGAEDAPFAWFQLAVPVDAPDPAASPESKPAGAAAAPAAEPVAVPAILPAHVPAAANTAAPVAGDAAPILLPAGFAIAAETTAPAAPAAPEIAALVTDAPPAKAPAAGAAPILLPAAPAQTTPRAAVRTEIPAGVTVTTAEMPAREAAPAEAPRAAAPQLRTVQPLVAVPPRFEAVQPLITALVPEIAPVLHRAGLRDTAAAVLSPLAMAELHQAPRQVTATTDAQQGTLDMSRQEWMGAMIETIEALREAPSSRETSIRLSPDALGTVDIAISQEGDRVHVHFTADTPAARAMLSEAQPRLAELAEAKGVRLGQATVDGGAPGQGGQRQDDAQRPQLNSTPAGARAEAEAQTESDQRIA